MTRSDAPYVGPTPFTTDDRLRFFGRDRESGELASLVLSHPITLLVASSGAGKTSLVNAGLVPRLTGIDDGIPRCEVLPVVLFRQAAARVTDDATFENRFLAYAVAALDSPDAPLPGGAGGSLANALENRPLIADRFGQPLPRVLIVDQFEELFTLHPQFWEDRLPFLQELLTIAEREPMTRILLSMREEYLARLEQLAGSRGADSLRFRLHLERLDRDKAIQAVTGPLPGDIHFDDGVAEALVDELRMEAAGTSGNGSSSTLFPGKYVEPVQLQVVCRALWNDLPEGTTLITEALREEFGSIDQALENFYASIVADAAATDPAVPEGMIRHWIEDDLISSRMSRNTVPLDDAEAAGISRVVLDRLVDEHLLRREDRFNFPWYELTHDRLIAPVLASNAAWFADNPDPLYAVQQQTRQWLREDQQAGYLLTGEPLKEAATFAQAHPDLLTREEHEFVRASEALERDLREGERRRKRSRNIALACALAAAAMLLLAVYAFRLKQDAERQQQISLAQSVAAQAMLASAGSQDDLGALLARQAYLFDTGGDVRGETGTALQTTIGSPFFSRRLQTPHLWISALAFSPGSGEYLASAGGAGEDSSVALWHLNDGDYVADTVLVDPALGSRTHSSGATSLAFSGDGAILATGGGDGFVKLWDTGSGELQHSLFGPGGSIRALVAGSDSDGTPILVAASCLTNGGTLDPAQGAPSCQPQSATIRIWSLDDPEAPPLDLETGGMARLDAVAMSADGRWLAAAGCESFFEGTSFCETGLVLLWQLGGDSADFERLEGHTGTVFAVTFIEQEGEPPLLASGGEDRVVRIWDLADLAEPEQLIGHRDVVQSLAYSPVLNTLAGGDHDASVGIWSLDQRDPVISILGHATDWIRSLVFSPSGTMLASTTGGGEIRFWNLGPRSQAPAVFPGHDDYVRAFDFANRDGPPLLASAGEDGRVRIWTFDGPMVSEEVVPLRDDGASFKISSVAWDQAGERILTGAEDGVARLSVRNDDGTWSTTPVNVIPFRSGAVYVQFAPDDSLVFTGDATGQVRIWSLLGGEPRGVVLPGADVASPIQAMVLSDDGTMLAVGYKNGDILVWTLSDQGRTATILQSIHQETEIKALAFGPDLSLAAGGPPGTLQITVRIWDIDTGELTTALSGIQGEVRSLAFSPDGSQLATGSKDQSVLLWDTSDWEAQPVRVGIPEWVRALEYSPDGTMIVVPTTQGGIRTIDPSLDSLSEAVCDNVRENLSLTAWTGLISNDTGIAYQKTCESLGVPDVMDPADVGA